MKRFLGIVLTAIGVPVVALALLAIFEGVLGKMFGMSEPEYSGPFIGIGIAGMAVGLCLCFAGWLADHKT